MSTNKDKFYDRVATNTKRKMFIVSSIEKDNNGDPLIIYGQIGRADTDVQNEGTALNASNMNEIITNMIRKELNYALGKAINYSIDYEKIDLYSDSNAVVFEYQVEGNISVSYPAEYNELFNIRSNRSENNLTISISPRNFQSFSETTTVQFEIDIKDGTTLIKTLNLTVVCTQLPTTGTD